MSGIAVRLWCHDEIREVACWGCRRSWNEQLLGISLCDGRDVVGSLCPACLQRSPREVAAEIGGYGFALQAAIDCLAQSLWRSMARGRMPEGIDEIHGEIARVKQNTAQLRILSELLSRRSIELRHCLGRVRSALNQSWKNSMELLMAAEPFQEGNGGWVNPRHLPAITQEANLVQGKLLIAEELAVRDEHKWEVDLAQTITVERALLRRRYGFGTDDNLFDMVDRRYQLFLRLVETTGAGRQSL